MLPPKRYVSPQLAQSRWHSFYDTPVFIGALNEGNLSKFRTEASSRGTLLAQGEAAALLDRLWRQMGAAWTVMHRRPQTATASVLRRAARLHAACDITIASQGIMGVGCNVHLVPCCALCYCATDGLRGQAHGAY
eukprot:2377296-Rhodomonas_salina.2